MSRSCFRGATWTGSRRVGRAAPRPTGGDRPGRHRGVQAGRGARRRTRPGARCPLGWRPLRGLARRWRATGRAFGRGWSVTHPRTRRCWPRHLRRWARQQPDASTRTIDGQVEIHGVQRPGRRDPRTPARRAGDHSIRAGTRWPDSARPGSPSPARTSARVTRCLSGDTPQRVRRGLMEVTDDTLGGFDGCCSCSLPTRPARSDRNTPMPLSIAYLDGLGRIVSTPTCGPAPTAPTARRTRPPDRTGTPSKCPGHASPTRPRDPRDLRVDGQRLARGPAPLRVQSSRVRHDAVHSLRLADHVAQRPELPNGCRGCQSRIPRNR